MNMKLFFPFIAIILSLTVQSQTAKNMDSIPFIYMDDTENFVYFPGGDSALYRFISDNLVYPDNEGRNEIEGIVYVRFSIDSIGKISDVEIIRGSNPGFDKAVFNVISKMPNWIWDMSISNRNRKCLKTLPIKFSEKKL